MNILRVKRPGKMGRFDVKKKEKAPSNVKKKEEDLVAGTPFRGKLSLGRVKHSTLYRSSSTAGKETRGDDFWNAYK